MYSVSEEFLAKLQEHTRVEHVRGTIGTALFTDSNVLSMSVSNRCSDTADINFGSAYVGQLQATFVNVNIPRGSWGGQVITLQWGLVIEEASGDDPEVVEWVPIGKFTVASAEWTDTGVNIVANDNMEKLDRSWSGQQTGQSSLYTFAKYACEQCNVTLANSAEDMEALPNGDQLITLYPENDIKTYRDLMSWIACSLGGFVTANRTGEIEFRSFRDSEVVDEWGASERIAGSSFSDYSTYYDGISIVEMETQELKYYSAGTGNGEVIKLGSNPLLQYGLELTKTAERTLLAQIAHSIEWTPFQTRTLSNLVYDLGDLVTCTDGVAGSEELTCAVLSYEWTFKNVTSFTGYGADPRLAKGQSRTDKNLQGILSKIDSEDVTYYLFKNVDQITLANEVSTELGAIEFASKKTTEVEVELEAKIDVSRILTQTQVPVYKEEVVIDPDTGEPVIDPDTGEPVTEIVPNGFWMSEDGEAVATVNYYYDGNLIGYEPVETWDIDGFHTIHYGYVLPNVDEDNSHTFVAKMEIAGGSGIILADDCFITLKGQALAGDEFWDGKITAEDTTGLYEIMEVTPVSFQDGTPEFNVHTPLLWGTEFTDSPEVQDFRPVEPLGVAESLSVIVRNMVFRLVSEDGAYNYVSADGTYNITTEGND